VNRCQQGNRVLKYIRNIGWEFGNIVPDFIMASDACSLYLSLRYHLLHPTYIGTRVQQLKNSFRLRVLMCLVDIEDSTKPLQELAVFAIRFDLTLILAWSNEEAGRYLESYKMLEHKGPELLKERAKDDHQGKLRDVLTAVRSVNKTDAANLLANFGSFHSIMGASMEDLSLCPGIGEMKVQRLYSVFHQPFTNNLIKKTPSELSTQIDIGGEEEIPLNINWTRKRKKLNEVEED